MPLRISYYCSAAFFLITLLIFIYAIVRSIADPMYSAILPVIVAVMFFIGAVLLFVIGILGAYLSRVYTEAKKRPEYIISQTNTRQNYFEGE